MKKISWLIVVALIVLLDQGTKYLAMTELLPYVPKAIFPILNLTLARNTGAAFSFLNSAGEWHYLFFIVFSSGMSLVLLIWIIRCQDRFELYALSLILGGAWGNLIDRLTRGYVVDFIDVYYKNHHWPVFNIADSAICIGAVILACRLYTQRTT